MAAVRSTELVIERGEGIWLYDDSGNRYLDGTAALWYANVGHGRKEIADAVAAQFGKIEAWSIFGDTATPASTELADRLVELAPMDGGRVFFGSGGGDGIEAAAKLARRYFDATGSPDRIHIISREKAYHGSQAFGTSIGGIAPNRAGIGPLVPSTSTIAWDSADALRDEIAKVGADRVAAFFMEPVIGAGGVYPPPDGYVEAVAEICRENGVIFVLDATICGFGRVGTWFAAERWGVRPDMIIFAKGVTSGYLPLGGVVVSDRIAEPFWNERGNMFRHGQTYAGHATCCAAGLANIEIMERDGLVERGQTLEKPLYDAVASVVDHPLVAGIRGGTGLMAAVELSPELLGARPGAAFEAYKLVRDVGLLMTRPMLSSLAVSPPLTITEAEIEEIGAGFRAGLDALLERVEPELAAATAA
ncbi:MAG: aspartate aminotransferase family protein [Actinobacteria bacterium]|nr:aspartate aminotransferase family protein [Actinomycetota bacterium]